MRTPPKDWRGRSERRASCDGDYVYWPAAHSQCVWPLRIGQPFRSRGSWPGAPLEGADASMLDAPAIFLNAIDPHVYFENWDGSIDEWAWKRIITRT